MQSKILLGASCIGGAIVIAFFTIVIFLPGGTRDRTLPAEQSNLPSQQVDLALPVRLRIPKIGVDAAVEQIGLTPSGAMGVPKDPTDVAWFSQGPRPGESGSAVLSGHYSSKNYKPSAFDNLYKLRKGDTVSIESDTGTTTTFVVRESRRYDPSADATGVFVSSDGKAHLNLITCEGVWDKVNKSYSLRLVVFADKV